MRSWPRSTERLLGVSARLLAVASVLTTIGVGLAIWFAWRQSDQALGPDGPPDSAQRLTVVMFDLSYRQVAIQLVFASVLVGAAVLLLHRQSSWAKVRLVRWEVLGAGLVTLVPVVALVLANLYVLTTPDDASDTPAFFGPEPMTELTLGNLTTLVAGALILTLAGLWWLRLEPVADACEDDTADLAADHGNEPADEPRDSLDNLGNGAAMGYPQDWSPEDFRPPR